MPIYSFAKSAAGFFVQSNGKARNPGRTPTGQNPTYIAVSAKCLGFWKFSGGGYDLSKWFSQCTVTETARPTSTSPFTRAVLYETPLYKSPLENLPNPTVLQTDSRWSTFTLPSQYSTQVLNVTADTITIQLSSIPSGTPLLLITATVGGAEREYSTPQQDVDNQIPDLLDFPNLATPVRRYQIINGPNLLSLGDGGGIPLRRVQSTIGLSTDLDREFTFPVVNPYYAPKADINFGKTKARYKSSAAATEYIIETKEIGGSFVPNTVLSQSQLPLGIDVADPPGWPATPPEFLGLPLEYAVSQTRTNYRAKLIVPPEPPP